MILTADSTRLDDELLDEDITSLEDGLANVQATANGKNKVVYSSTTPTGTFQEGDVWFDEANDNQINIWNGSTWETAALGADAIDLFSAARGIFSYLDVHSLTAAEIAALLAVFHQITSQDGTSYWDLDTGEFHTENGEFTGSVTGSTITGSTLQTTAGALKAFLQRADGSIYATNPADPNYAFVKIMNQGLQAINPNNLTNYYAQFLHGFFSDVEGENFYGFYITPALFARKLFIDSGPIISKYDILDYETASQSITAVTGVTALIRRNIGVVTLRFENFSFAANTATDSETYALNTDFAPLTDLDLVSTHNQVRFKITAAGFIQPYTKPTAATAVRGSFTYMVAGGDSGVVG